MQPNAAFKKSSLLYLLQMLITGGVLILLFVGFSISNPHFLSGANLMNLTRQMAPWLLLAIGQGIVMIGGNMDLSMGAVAGLSCILSASLMGHHSMGAGACVLLTLLVCLAIGLVNGLLVGVFRLPFLPVTGIIGFLVYLWTPSITNGYNVLPKNPGVEAFSEFFYYGNPLGLFNPTLISLALLVVFSLVMIFTPFGRTLRAAGKQRAAARLGKTPQNAFLPCAGAKWSVVSSYGISALLAGLVGIVATAMLGMGILDMGKWYESYAIVIALIGGIGLFGGRGSLWGVALGAAIWAVLSTGMQFAQIPSIFRNIFFQLCVGVACFLALGLLILDVVQYFRYKAVRNEAARIPAQTQPPMPAGPPTANPPFQTPYQTQPPRAFAPQPQPPYPPPSYAPQAAPYPAQPPMPQVPQPPYPPSQPHRQPMAQPQPWSTAQPMPPAQPAGGQPPISGTPTQNPNP